MKAPGAPRGSDLKSSPVPRKTHYMPPAVSARVHAIANGTAARGTIEMLALIEPLGGMWAITVITIATRHIMRGSPSRH